MFTKSLPNSECCMKSIFTEIGIIIIKIDNIYNDENFTINDNNKNNYIDVNNRFIIKYK